jgi:tRNA-dihydrouridine synthase 3
MNIYLRVYLAGVFPNKISAHKIVPLMYEAGASVVTLHGRTKEARYTKLADWDYISECSNLANTSANNAQDEGEMAFFGNGDIFSWEDYEKRTQETNVSGVMIGRGALIKPWIFKEIKEKKVWDIRSSERMDIYRQFCNYGLEHWGSDTQGVK